MRFSVIIPVFNRCQLLPRALNSIRVQTFPNFEVIVVDDGSEDDPKTVVASLRDERFKCVRQKNSGPAAARNHGARLAKGNIITFLDSDDEVLPNWLESLDHSFEEYNAVIVCCGSEYTGGEQTYTSLPRDMGKLFDHVTARFAHGGDFAMRREVFERVGGYDPKVRAGEHAEMAMRLLPIAKEENWKIHNIREALMRRHLHAGPRLGNNAHALFSGSTYVLEKHRRLFEKDPKKHSSYHAVAGVNAARIGLPAEARYHLRKSAVLNPFSMRSWLRMVIAHIPGLVKYWWRE